VGITGSAGKPIQHLDPDFQRVEPIAECVVHFEQHREAIPPAARDDVELPQWAAATQREDHQLSGQPGSTIEAGVTVETVHPDVVLGAESGFVNPRRCGQRDPGWLDPPAQYRQPLGSLRQQPGHPAGIAEIGRAECRQRAEVHRRHVPV